MSSSGSRWAAPAVTTTALLWGTTGAVSALIPQVNAVAVGAASVGGSGLILGITTLRTIRSVYKAPGAAKTIVLGALALVLYMPLFYLSVAWAGVALGTVLSIGAAPVIAGIMEWLFERRRVTRIWTVAAALTILGASLMVAARHHPAGGESAPLALGVLAAAAAALTYALYAYQVRRLVAPCPLRPSGLPHLPSVAAIQTAASVPMLCIFAMTSGPHAFEASAWPLLLYLVLVPTALGHALFSYGLGGMNASSATLITVLEPVAATVLAVVFFGEGFEAFGWFGFGLVILGITLVSVGQGSVNDHGGKTCPSTPISRNSTSGSERS